jgi:hypothetical protein
VAADAYLRRVSSRTVEQLLADPMRIRKVLFPSSTETVIDDEVLITVSAWQLVDDALGNAAFLAKGGAAIGEVMIGDGPARGFTSAEVRRLSAKLALTSEADLGKHPAITSEAISDFTNLKDFVLETAKAEAGMIVYVG